MIFPKKPQLLYAPMIGTLGGGSMRSFGRGTGSGKLYDFTSHTFTNGGTVGRNGPSLSALQSQYSISGPVAWDMDASLFTVVNNGTQRWTVPADGSYRIRAVGACGGNVPLESGDGGYGASMQGDFVLSTSTILNIIVGQEGKTVPHHGQGIETAAGGGGGSFVWLTGDTEPLIAAGGGGGQSDVQSTDTRHANYHATTSTTARGGTSAGPVHYSNGGSSGTGGFTRNPTIGGNNTAGAGGGFKTNGESWSPASAYVWGIAALNNGTGGEGGKNTNYTQYGVNTDREGGFGGGGGADGWWGCSGAGGGYSGGGSGVDSPRTAGGGGGSYNSGTNQTNLDFYVNGYYSGHPNSDGRVEITYLG